MEKKYIYIALAASVIGVIVTVILSLHHYNMNYQSALLDAVCGVKGDTGCNIVNRSDASEFLGYPLALWGFIFYLLSFALLLFYLITPASGLLQTLFLMSAFAFAVDIGLFLYSIAALNVVCNMCILSYLATLAILFFTFLSISKIKEGFMPNLESIRTRNIQLPYALIAVIILVFVSGGMLQAVAKGSSTNKGSESTGSSKYHLEKAIEAYFSEYDNAKVVLKNPISVAKKGAVNSAITITEYADFMCPHCQYAATKINDLYKKNPKTVSVVYRHFPLDNKCNPSMKRQLHEGACLLSYASQCAKEQNKFWPMHDAIFKKQEAWSRQGVSIKEINKLAARISLNRSTFNKCMNSDKAKKAVAADIKEAMRLGISGTPAIYINGRDMKTGLVDFLFEQLLIRESNKLRGRP